MCHSLGKKIQYGRVLIVVTHVYKVNSIITILYMSDLPIYHFINFAINFETEIINRQ